MRAGLRKISPEIVYAEDGLVVATSDVVAMLRDMAAEAPRRRARLCAHPDSGANQQEMLIVMSGDGYVRPHRHFGKSETFTVLEGAVDALIFEDDGRLRDVIEMRPFGSGGAFFYRMPEGVFHSLRYRSDWLVFLETTGGPFDPARSEGAPWAPPETEIANGRAFIDRVCCKAPSPSGQ